MFTEANVETAMCLWEAALELRNYPTAGIPAKNYTPKERSSVLLDNLWERDGTVTMRHTIISWVPECEAEWEADREKGTELVPYDWEHCPAFLERKLGELV